MMIWINEKITLTVEELETLNWLKDKEHIYYLSQVQKRFKHTIYQDKNGDLYVLDYQENGEPNGVVYDSLETANVENI